MCLEMLKPSDKFFSSIILMQERLKQTKLMELDSQAMYGNLKVYLIISSQH